MANNSLICDVCGKAIPDFIIDQCVRASSGVPALLCTYCACALFGVSNIMEKVGGTIVVQFGNCYCTNGPAPSGAPKRAVYTGATVQEAADRLLDSALSSMKNANKETVCALCGVAPIGYILHKTSTGTHVVCDTCAFVIEGKTTCRTIMVDAGGIHLMVEPGSVPRLSAAYYKGNSLPISDDDLFRYVDQMRKVLSQHKLVCTNCGTPMVKAAGCHFSGVFCKACWEKYKAANSGICRMCGKPRYQCYC